MKSVALISLIVALCSCMVIKSSDNKHKLEIIKFETQNQRWIARHWVEKNGKHTYFTTCAKDMPISGIAGFILNGLLKNVDTQFFYTEEKFLEIKDACQSRKLQSIVADKKECHG